MLNPSWLTAVLSQSTQEDIKASVLLTPQGRLIAYASSPPTTSEDLIKVLLGIIAEAWREARSESARLDPDRVDFSGVEHEIAMVESEVCFVFPLLYLFLGI